MLADVVVSFCGELDVGAADADPLDVDDRLAGGRHRGWDLLQPVKVVMRGYS